MINLDEIMGSAPAPVEAAPVECPPPGVYYDVPASVYHKWPAISSTLLKTYADLPSTARIPFVPGDDANMGSGLHAYCLQGQAGFDLECIVGPKFGKGKGDIEARAVFQAMHPGKVVLPWTYGSPAPGLPVMEILKGVDSSLHGHKKVGPLLRESKKEVSLVWVDENSGCLCKARLDIYDGVCIWDLKKTRAISSFQWQIKDLNYAIQGGHYVNGAIANNLPVAAFGLIPCELYPPYQIDCGYLEPDKLEMAKENAKRLIGLVKQSQISGNWPNYRVPEHIYDLDDIQPDDLVKIY